MTEMKRCPFCGGQMRLQYSSRTNSFEFYHKAYAIAAKCKFVEPFQIIVQENVKCLADAEEVWNRRFADEVQKKTRCD